MSDELTKEHGIELLGLQINTFNALMRSELKTIGSLTEMCACQILDVRNVGWKSMEDIIDRLHEKGFCLSSCKQNEKNAD